MIKERVSIMVMKHVRKEMSRPISNDEDGIEDQEFEEARVSSPLPEGRQRLPRYRDIKVNAGMCSQAVDKGIVSYVQVTLNRQEYQLLQGILHKANVNIMQQLGVSDTRT